MTVRAAAAAFALALSVAACSQSDRHAVNESLNAAATDAARAANAVATDAAHTITNGTIATIRSHARQLENGIDTTTNAASPPAKNFARATAIKAKLIAIDAASGANTNVVAAGPNVNLTGSVRRASDIEAFEKAALSIPGVQHVTPHLSVKPDLPSPTQPASDLALGAEVRANLALAGGLDTANLDVAASSGKITLSGTVASAAERMRLEKATRETPGVSVVDDLLSVR